MGDGASIVAALTTDPRFTPAELKVKGEEVPGPHVLVATQLGQVMRVPFAPFRTPSTKVGRKFCKLADGDRVIYIELVTDATTMFLATEQARVLHFAIADVPVLNGAGKGVRGMKLEGADKVLGAVQLTRPSDCLRVRNVTDKELSFGQLKYGVTARGGKGIKTSHRTGFAEILREPIELVDWAKLEGEK
jgi:DNA gyrase subunit A